MMNKPNNNIYAFFMIHLVYLNWNYYLSVKFVMWIVSQKIENKQKLGIFLKNVISFTHVWEWKISFEELAPRNALQQQQEWQNEGKTWNNKNIIFGFYLFRRFQFLDRNF